MSTKSKFKFSGSMTNMLLQAKQLILDLETDFGLVWSPAPSSLTEEEVGRDRHGVYVRLYAQVVSLGMPTRVPPVSMTLRVAKPENFYATDRGRFDLGFLRPGFKSFLKTLAEAVGKGCGSTNCDFHLTAMPAGDGSTNENYFVELWLLDDEKARICLSFPLLDIYINPLALAERARYAAMVLVRHVETGNSHVSELCGFSAVVSASLLSSLRIGEMEWFSFHSKVVRIIATAHGPAITAFTQNPGESLTEDNVLTAILNDAVKLHITHLPVAGLV